MAFFGLRRGQGEPFSIVVWGSTVERDQTFICGLGPGDGGLARARSPRKGPQALPGNADVLVGILLRMQRARRQARARKKKVSCPRVSQRLYVFSVA